MSEAMVKGDLILKILEHITNKRGAGGIRSIGIEPSQFQIEKWYPMEEFIQLINQIDEVFGDGQKSTASHIGYEIIKLDLRWQMLFKDKDPKDIFMTTKRQDGQYRGGSTEATISGEKVISIKMSGWPKDMGWYEFYKGRLQAVLELTGSTGVVEISCIELDDEPTCIYDISWN